MGWFWAPLRQTAEESAIGTTSTFTQDELTCPVMHTSSSRSKDQINLLNYMPHDLTKVHEGQKLDLTTQRTISSIPKGSEKGKWEYPSAQQMYNAMMRKGKINGNEGDEDTIESMVQIHNFLNESCWQEILRWENRYVQRTNVQPKLLKFMGKPDNLSPRARMHYYLSYIFPNTFARELPFDRHDWLVLRGDPKSRDTDNPGYRKVRYVLDFYGGPDDENGFPTFSVDVRPALDNFVNAKDRMDAFTLSMLQKYVHSSKMLKDGSVKSNDNNQSNN
ncbi:hypothetical protein KAFR_0K00500 [Kazachstania africana CBS 2517]|uniref:Holocytochrome c-type synthase n=1 Tax=Kazachstania africana (strain ATCC 22294 / BCRC 22015 / CBS 2517 / CECT 1963 / NBRC 1671 / NRRL Y-8276) TaxID=1071382 RepID=H2B1A5_KAZAF|nr:hypothetical protein KAFR_0K00500 [Kazachstania africana CBS 2517]CCF60405.1 hypothetical protein KAFR_0K00500 [Kazachstania africana CBS 2517]